MILNTVIYSFTLHNLPNTPFLKSLTIFLLIPTSPPTHVLLIHFLPLLPLSLCFYLPSLTPSINSYFTLHPHTLASYILPPYITSNTPSLHFLALNAFPEVHDCLQTNLHLHSCEGLCHFCSLNVVMFFWSS